MDAKLERGKESGFIENILGFRKKTSYMPKILEIKAKNDTLEIICESPKADYLPGVFTVWIKRQIGWAQIQDYLKIEKEQSGCIINMAMVPGRYKVRYVQNYQSGEQESKETIIISE